jgi:ATP-dependent exoDNAse (exonuclease V) beta subunit
VPRGEMVVLLRAFTHLDAYEDSLERAGLRPYVVGGRGYWSQQQVADVGALLAVIANPLDDHALLGALASSACGAAPDTLWLLRAAAGKRRHIWPAVEQAASSVVPLSGYTGQRNHGTEEGGLADPERLLDIPGAERELLWTFAGRIAALRERGSRISLAALIVAAVTETGYDLAVLSRPTGEARFANVRKMARLAAEFEAREGRDLRGFLDFLAARAEGEAEAQAATAAEGHDGVRVMTVHNAKGLEFEVVAVPDLARSLLAGGRAPLLVVGREDEPRVGLQLRRLGAAAINLYDYGALCEEARERDSEEGLRLFHVAATRAKRRLILSGVVKPEAGKETKPSTPVVERLVEALGVPRDADATVPVAPPEPRPGLEAAFEASEIAVRANLPSPERAEELRALRRREASERDLGDGPPPLVERDPPVVPSRPLSYTAISAYKECPYRFYLERVLGLARSEQDARADGEPSSREERTARGAAVHSLLEWSQANGWAVPSQELATRHAVANSLKEQVGTELIPPVEQWIESPLQERITSEEVRTRAEVPLLLGVGGTVLRGSIDLLVEREGKPLVVDYKTDRLGDADPSERAGRYEVQRSIYALAVAEALDVAEVEVAYVFLERADEPVVTTVGPAEMVAAREALEVAIAQISRGEFPVAPPEQRDWSLCRGCPALRGLCSGPGSVEAGGKVVEI